MTAAWALLVVSSDQQAETLADQRAWAEEAARSKGWSLSRVFSGVSTGKAGPRRLLREMIAELRALRDAERPAWVMMTRADRVGRGRIVESQVALHEISDLGCRIWTRDAGEVKLDSATDQIIAAVKAGLATLENEVRRDKAVSVYQRKRAAGLTIGNKRPYGLRWTPHGDAVDEERAAIVREVFRLRLSGHGLLTIARMIAEAAPPYALKDGSFRPLRWDAKRVRAILGRRAYVPLVIDEITFARAAAVSEGMTREFSVSPASPNARPLVGSIRCWCGQAMYGKTTGSRSYYMCISVVAHGKYRLVRSERLESQFLERLRAIEADASLIDAYRNRARTGPSVKVLERGRAEVSAELDGIAAQRSKVWEMHTLGLLRDEDLQERLDAVSAQRAVLEGRVRELDAEIATAKAAIPDQADGIEDLMRRAAAAWEGASLPLQRSIARSFSVYLGGLCVEENGTLTVRRVEPRIPRTKRA